MVALETLKDLQFLQDLPDEDLRKLATVAEVKEFAPGATIFREGQASPFVYLVASGTITLDITVAGRGPSQFQTVGAGELLGWTPLIDGGAMTATARARTAARLIAINANQVRAMSAANPGLAAEIMKRTARTLSRRLAATRLQLLDVYRDVLPVVRDEGGRG